MTNPNDPITGTEHTIASGLGGTIPGEWKHKGLTKREYFAALAMQGIVNTEMTYGIYNKPSAGETWRVSHCAEMAWYATEMADALIKELNK